MSYLRLSRRRFLQVLAGGAGVMMVGIGKAYPDSPPLPPGLLGDTFHSLGAYVRIDADGNVLIGARDPDTGTGVGTSLPRIIADEMDADWNRVIVVPLGLDVTDVNGQPRWTYGRQVGGMGTSIPSAWADLRPVGALVRWMLLQAAATRLGVNAERLRCESGTVIAPDGRRVTYGSLAGAASAVALPARTPPLKSPAQYRLIGHGAGDIDAQAMVTGHLRFALDERPGDFLVAVLAQCPWADGTLAQLDSKEALAVDGVVKVVTITPEAGLPWGTTAIAPAVAVLARNTWSALQGRLKLKLAWKPGASGSEDSNLLEQQAGKLLDGKTEPTARVRNDGDVDAAGKHAARRFGATYFQP
ncbi:MAG: molybdopterin cofactor-binding domain-containing protein, partial [Rhodanobacter sp.]